MDDKKNGFSEPGAPVRGWFFLILGSALLLHIIIPSQFVVSLFVLVGAIIMILYGAHIVGLYSVCARLFHKITKS